MRIATFNLESFGKADGRSPSYDERAAVLHCLPRFTGVEVHNDCTRRSSRSSICPESGTDCSSTLASPIQGLQSGGVNNGMRIWTPMQPTAS
jgi:hypothetical protein